jgi:hypothetical protein
MLAQATEGGLPDFTSCNEMVQLLKRLERGARSAGTAHEPIQRFWHIGRIDKGQDARRISFGLSLPHSEGGDCVLEDGKRFSALMSALERYRGKRSLYRRCFRGLMMNYFSYDPFDQKTPAAGRENWTSLREYLQANVASISDTGVRAERLDPDWVTCLQDNPHLFGKDPCAPYGEELLLGRHERLAHIREALAISGSSWFVRELVLARIAAAVQKSDTEFTTHLPGLLSDLATYRVLRDRGMVSILNRYALVPSRPLNIILRDRAVEWWGNPWLASNRMRWGSVVTEARALVEEWLKLEFVEAFFTLLAEEGAGERRRLAFWKRYVNSIDHIQFALGSNALFSHSKDFATLRAKMDGLITELRDPNGANNAFVMTMGDLVLVEFSGSANALYGYRKGALPFDLSSSVGISKNARNSLKTSTCEVWLRHADGIHGYDTWEEMFEATLQQHFHLSPMAATKRRAPSERPLRRQTPARSAAPVVDHSSPLTSAQAERVRYSPEDLARYAKGCGLTIEDNSGRGGNLWVRTTQWEVAQYRVLSAWGFKYKEGKGWWR